MNPNPPREPYPPRPAAGPIPTPRPYTPAPPPPPPTPERPVVVHPPDPLRDVIAVIVLSGLLLAGFGLLDGNRLTVVGGALLALLTAAGYIAYGHWREVQVVRLARMRWMARAQADAITDREAQQTRRAMAELEHKYAELEHKPLELILEAHTIYARVLHEANRKAELDPSFRAVLDSYREMLGEMDDAFMPYTNGQGRTLTEQQHQERLYTILSHLGQLAFGVMHHRSGTKLRDEPKGGKS